MIKCTCCNRPLTEFDVELYKNLRKTDSLQEVICYNCLINDKIRRAIYWKKHVKKYTFFYVAPSIVILSIVFLACLNLIPPEAVDTETILGRRLSSLIMGIFLISTVGGSFVFLRDSNALSEFMAGPRLIGQHEETTLHYDGLNWVGTTKKVNNYDFLGCITPFLVFITFIAWSGVFWLFNILRYHMICPIRVKFAYAKTKRTVDDARVSLKARMAYHIHNKLYNLRLAKVKKKYSYLDKKELQEEINKIKKKTTVTYIAGKKAIVEIIQKKQITVIIKKNEIVVIRNIFDNSFVYDEVVNMNSIGISPHIIQQLEKIL